MANIPDVNFNKIPNKSAKFNQAEFYEENFEKVNEQIVPKINEMDTKINVEIPAQLAETEQEIMSLKEDYATRIDNIIATPVPVGEIIAQEIIDARQGALSLGANLIGVKEQTSEIASLPLNIKGDGVTDNLMAIQNALNIGKHVLINTPGVYMIDGTLIISSNTTLELGEGVIIKQKSLGQNLLKNSDPTNGNINITIKGGTWDYNYTNTTPNGDTHQLHAIVLQKINNLTIQNVIVEDAIKYAWLLADITDLTVNGLAFDTRSDGLHLMGPLKDAEITNLRGKTGDNLLAFTIGDYATYELSRGNMTDIHVSGIYCKDTFQPIRLVGNTGYYFDNIIIENVFGTVATNAVFKAVQDTADLDFTDIRNLTLRNFECYTTNSQIIILDCKNADNIIIDNIHGGSVNYEPIYIDSNANIKDLVIKNLKPLNNMASNVITVKGNVNNLSVDGIRAMMVSGSTKYLLSNGGTIGYISMRNIVQINGSACIYVGGITNTINVSDFDISGVGVFLTKMSSGITNLNISDGYITYTIRFVTNQSATTSELKVRSKGVVFASDTGSRFLIGGLGTISVNGTDFRAKDANILTPRDGDIIFNTASALFGGVGLYIYDLSLVAWRKL